MTVSSIAINSDVAEGFGAWSFGADEDLLEHISAANVACGFHAGDPVTIRRVTAACAERGISIGAQVSYRDLAGFGRRFIAIDGPALVDDLVYQIGALEAFARIASRDVDYVKAHGALYNTAATHAEHAQALVDAVRETGAHRPILCQPGTEVWRRARAAGLHPICEVFADRAYTEEGLLVPRSQPGAVVLDPDTIAERAVRFVEDREVVTVTGKVHRFEEAPGAVCIHSDTPGAALGAERMVAALRAAGVRIVGVGAPQ